MTSPVPVFIIVASILAFSNLMFGDELPDVGFAEGANAAFSSDEGVFISCSTIETVLFIPCGYDIIQECGWKRFFTDSTIGDVCGIDRLFDDVRPLEELTQFLKLIVAFAFTSLTFLFSGLPGAPQIINFVFIIGLNGSLLWAIVSLVRGV